ncbi:MULTISPECIES: hypothetical protein [Streptomyces]|uniref:hypothetical protein n=1 Tax=Streptomyces TaxID=1883 RepID=UPI000A448CC0
MLPSQNSATPGTGSAGPPQRMLDAEIAALFEEYRTLREEVALRVASRMHMIGFAGVVSALLAVSNRPTFGAFNLYVAGLVLLFAVLWLRGVNLAVQRLGRHLRTVEERINSLAAEAWGAPAPVLTWETSAQAGRRRARRLPRWTARLGGWYTK